MMMKDTECHRRRRQPYHNEAAKRGACMAYRQSVKVPCTDTVRGQALTRSVSRWARASASLRPNDKTDGVGRGDSHPRHGLEVDQAYLLPISVLPASLASLFAQMKWSLVLQGHSRTTLVPLSCWRTVWEVTEFLLTHFCQPHRVQR